MLPVKRRTSELSPERPTFVLPTFEKMPQLFIIRKPGLSQNIEKFGKTERPFHQLLGCCEGRRLLNQIQKFFFFCPIDT
jgi:hypothetical protein